MNETTPAPGRTPTPIVVTGGTGTLGRLVVKRLLAAGVPVRVLSRSIPDAAARRPGVEYVAADLEQGDGIGAAVAGVDTVVHLAGSGTGDELKARNLVHAASAAQVKHLVYISVVGADRIPVVTKTDRNMFGYFEQKRAAELVVAESGIPHTTLRATQFDELVWLVAGVMAKLPVIPLPRGLRAQPVAAADVADHLVPLALGAPAGLVPDVAGPRVYDAAELLRGYLRAVGKRRPIVRIGLPGRAAKAMLGGANLSPERAVGTRTWEEVVAEQVGQRAVEDGDAELPGIGRRGGGRSRTTGRPVKAGR
ncbi:SDR family oxidoreductase [Agromyces sp. NPDC058484]|uniref:SDR family oxidoreductase n=1 Tax=Agromyces sp. NPDC058484 TaxID=3346524 RepID=UPI003655FEED